MTYAEMVGGVGSSLELTLSDWSAVAQIVATIVAAIGIIVSILTSVRALREVHRDRVLRHRPYLAFESGGWQLPIQFVEAGLRIPGFDPGTVEAEFKDMPENAISIRLADIRDDSEDYEPRTFGRLLNMGLGTAIKCSVTWVPETIKIGGESFDLDERKRGEPKYSRKWNRMQPSPDYLAPDNHSKLSRLPTFIDKDWEKKLQEVRGVLEIRCHDLLEVEYVVEQGFWMRTNYGGSSPTIHITFQDVVRVAMEKKKDADHGPTIY